MRQKRSQSSDTPGTTAPAAATRGRGGPLLTVLLAAACGALVFTYAEQLVRPWTSLVLTERLRLGFALDSALLVVALVVVVASARSARRARKSVMAAAVPLEGSLDEAPAESMAEGMGALAEVHSDVRVLQAQIRSLEEALSQQEATRIAEAETVPEPEALTEPERDPVADQATRDEVTREVLHRVRCTVRGLGVRMEGDPVAVDILARVDAAVDRLAATGLFERPTLSEPDHTLPLLDGVAVPQAFESSPIVDAVQVETTPVETVAPMASTPAMRMPLEVPDEEPVEPAVTTPAAAAADEPEVVLPVPPSPPAPEVHRGRRWLRRSTAA